MRKNKREEHLFKRRNIVSDDEANADSPTTPPWVKENQSIGEIVQHAKSSDLQVKQEAVILLRYKLIKVFVEKLKYFGFFFQKKFYRSFFIEVL